MLEAVLRTRVAIQISVSIMWVFVTMRKYISSNLTEQKYINNLVLEDHNKIQSLDELFKKMKKR